MGQGKRGTLTVVEHSEEFNGSKCQTYVHADNSYYCVRGGMVMARFHLTKAKGERKPGEICRHMCKNDSYVQKRPDGFVCCNPDHIKWGTYYENRMDQSPEARAASGKAAALTDGPSRGGKMPTAGGNLQRTCVHCGRTMSAAMHGRWHGDRCKHKLISALIIDDCYAQLNLIYDS